MPLNSARTRQLLKEFDFRSLFRDELGWDNHNGTLQITLDGIPISLGALAQKRGMVAYQFSTPAGERLPEYSVRRKIEQQVAKAAHEHLIIFTDAAQTTQIWQWVKREPGKPAACREHTFHKSQSGDALVQKLEAIVFTLDEEETLVLTDVTRRARAGFDVERVTKKFYEQFRKEHGAFLGFIKGITEVADHEWYASVMLNRLMFVYFIQRKGFLDGDRDYLRNRLQRCQQEHGKDKFYTFYRIFLLRLFHEGFGKRRKDRAPDLEKLIGNIPYLNGGLFDVHELEKPERYGKDIKIEDKAFERIFNYFDQYQWHLDERPLRADNEINPDVLGYIFEKYINQKQMGAYYTKEDITEYISKNTVLPFLFDAAKKACRVAFEGSSSRREEAHSKAGAHESQSLVTSAATPTIWDLLRENPDRYIYDAVKKGVELPLPKEINAGIKDVSKRGGWNKPAPSEFALPTEIWREVVARRQRYWEVRARLVAAGVSPAVEPGVPPGGKNVNSTTRVESSEVVASSITNPGGKMPPSTAGGTPAAIGITDINDFITLNLDLRQFAQDVIENCEGPDLLMAFWQAISTITVLDPTGGSGAFIFAALNILEPLYEACLDRMEAFLAEWNVASPSPSEERAGERRQKPLHPNYHKKFTEVLARVDAHPNRRYFVLKSITLNNLYAVDIMEEAVEICKLRLFLKLAAQVDPRPDKDNFGIEPLPDIDFNIRAGNTLVGYATADEVRRCMKELGGGQMKLMGEEELGSFARFNTRCADVEQAFSKFRQLQTEGDGSVPAADKQELQKRLKALEDELNRHLATEYGVKVSDKVAYDKWVKSHQPFHWFIQFYGILSSGGFDVIIGNPPYVEYSKVRKLYSLQKAYDDYSTNLYASCCFRAENLKRAAGYASFIVPVSFPSTDRMQPLRELLLAKHNVFHVSFSTRPSKLFEEAEQRLTIYIQTPSAKPRLISGGFLKWYSEERAALFSLLEFVEVEPMRGRHSIWPKIRGSREKAVFSKIAAMPTLVESGALVGGEVLYYKNTGIRYFNTVTLRPPKCWINGKAASSSRETHLSASRETKSAVHATLLSTTFFCYFQFTSNCRDLNPSDIRLFCTPKSLFGDAQLVKLSPSVEKDYVSKAKTITMQNKLTGTVELESLSPAKSKPILDEIDTVLAGHYGFTAEELDFILNYDIKYRLGRATENEED